MDDQALDDITIGRWRFDVAGARLHGPAGDRRLEDRAARTLALLCRERGKVVSHADILAEIWHGRSVSPTSVAVVIRDIRRQLGDDARHPSHIETIPKRGYRLAEARPSAPAAQHVPAAAEPPPPARRRMAFGAAAAAIALTLAGGLSALSHGAPTLVFVEPVHNRTGATAYEGLSHALGDLVLTQMSQTPHVTVLQASEPRTGPAQRSSLVLKADLILWNGEPTLSLIATDTCSGAILWSGMADGPVGVLARNTLRKLRELQARPFA